MTLIKSVSGIRGTIGGFQGENLTPPDVVKFISAYAAVLKSEHNGNPLVVIGRDGRISGEALSSLVASTLSLCGVDVIDCGLSTTPSVEMAVLRKSADAGIICTASHNPREWNALKFLDHNGEFISAELGMEIVRSAEEDDFVYATSERIGSIEFYPDSIDDHVRDVLNMKLVDADLVRQQNYRVCVDAINSTGAIAIPLLLKKMGVESLVLFGDDFGNFAHEAEPLPKNLTHLVKAIVESGFDLGVAVDPDVDRLVLVAEDGTHFGEEYTLVAIADYYLSELGTGNTVSNLSSSAALTEVTKNHGGSHFQSAVGERHVVDLMKKEKALIGGEGNGGIICPDLHYGRDAVAGLALFLTFLAKSGKRVSELRARYPDYFMAKEKIELKGSSDVPQLLDKISLHYQDRQMDRTDGLKIYFDNSWVHIRPSNTEPILRIYTEAGSGKEAAELAEEMIQIIGKSESK